MSQPFDALLREQARIRPDAVAVHFPRGRTLAAGWEPITFRALDAAADAHARGFASQGVQPGDRTLLAVRPGVGFYALVFGLVRCGAVPVFIDPGMGPKAMLGCIQAIEPVAVVAAPAADLVRRLRPAAFRSVRRVFVDGFTLPGATRLSRVPVAEGPMPEVPVNPDADAVIVFTSGSTGPAKGVAMTHRCMTARVRYVQEMLGLESGSTISETLLVYTVLEVCMGMTVVVPPMNLAKPATVDPDVVLATFSRFSPRIASASPVVWQRTVHRAQARGEKVTGLDKLLTTAAPIPVDLHRRIAAVFGDHTELFTPYGATEALPVAAIGTHEILSDTGARTARGEGTCVGKLAPGIEVRVLEVVDGPINPMRSARQAAPGSIGEIVVRGEAASPGYRAAPGADEAAKIPDEGGTWHRMGDLGWLDDMGRLWFCGRVSHRLRTAGGMVPSDVVEGVFDGHPGVARTALVGIGQPGHEQAVLCVELSPGATFGPDAERALLERATGTRWEGLVQRVLVHPGFPTDARHNSKIRREVLRAWVEARPSA